MASCQLPADVGEVIGNKMTDDTNSSTYLRIDRPRLDLIISNCTFDDDRNISEVSKWDALHEAFARMPGERQHVNEKSEDSDAVFETWIQEVRHGHVRTISKKICKFDDRRTPCDNCRAYCCRTLVFPHGTPESLIDAIGFDGHGFIVELPRTDQFRASVERSIRLKTGTTKIEHHSPKVSRK